MAPLAREQTISENLRAHRMIHTAHLLRQFLREEGRDVSKLTDDAIYRRIKIAFPPPF